MKIGWQNTEQNTFLLQKRFATIDMNFEISLKTDMDLRLVAVTLQNNRQKHWDQAVKR